MLTLVMKKTLQVAHDAIRHSDEHPLCLRHEKSLANGDLARFFRLVMVLVDLLAQFFEIANLFQFTASIHPPLERSTCAVADSFSMMTCSPMNCLTRNLVAVGSVGGGRQVLVCAMVGGTVVYACAEKLDRGEDRRQT